MNTKRNKLNRSVISLFALAVITLVVLSLTLVLAGIGATPSLAAGPQQEAETVTFPQSGSAEEDVPPINAEVSKIIDLSWNELAFEIQRGGFSNTALKQCGDTYEPDNTYTTASSITVNGAAQIHNFHEAGDVDWVEFTVTAGETYTITTSNLAGTNDTVLYLYDTNGTTLLTWNDDCPFFGLASCINSWTAPGNGTYFILVRHYNSSAGGCTGYEYDLAVGGPAKIFLPIIMKASTGGGSPSTFEGQLIDLINNYRTSQGRATLSQVSILMQVAEAHSQDMHDRDFFSHINPDGLGPGERLTNAGYNWNAWGETIGCGQSTPQAMFDTWKASSTHNTIMLDVNFTEIGVGYVSGGTCGHYWTAVFAKPQ